MVKWAVKKPVKVATVKYTGDNLNEIINFVGAEMWIGIHLLKHCISIL